MHHSITKLTENEWPMKLTITSLSKKSKFKKKWGMKNKMILMPIFVHLWIMPEVLLWHVHMCFHIFSSTIKFNTNTNNLYFT